MARHRPPVRNPRTAWTALYLEDISARDFVKHQKQPFAGPSSPFDNPFSRSHRFEISRLAFSPDGRWLAAANAGIVQVYAVPDWTPLRAIDPPRHGPTDPFSGTPSFSPNSLGWSPDGRWLSLRTSAVKEETYRGRLYRDLIYPSRTSIWDVETGAVVAFRTHEEEDLSRPGQDPAVIQTMSSAVSRS